MLSYLLSYLSNSTI